MDILYIEDDAMNRRVVRDMLKVAGVDMLEASDAETGLRLIDGASVDVVLMDLRMPGVDGLTAIDRIRGRMDAKSRVPIIVVTADTARDLWQRCQKHGADDMLLKPVAMDSLFDSIGRVLASRLDGDPPAA